VSKRWKTWECFSWMLPSLLKVTSHNNYLMLFGSRIHFLGWLLIENRQPPWTVMIRYCNTRLSEGCFLRYRSIILPVESGPINSINLTPEFEIIEWRLISMNSIRELWKYSQISRFYDLFFYFLSTSLRNVSTCSVSRLGMIISVIRNRWMSKI
jgi:hypothetical protein